MSPEHRYETLDFLRGIAAIAVVILHISNYFTLFELPHVHLAVDFFFLLSGFVISHAYDRRLLAGMSAGQFMIRRLIRLYPMVIVGVLLGSIVLFARRYLFGDLSLASIATSVVSGLLLCPTPALTYFRPWAFPVNSPLWSLSAEIAANILYAIGFRFLTIRALIAACAIGAVGTIATTAWYGTLDVGFRWDDVPLAYVRILFPFACGLALGRVAARTPRRNGWGSALSAVMLTVALFAPIDAGWSYDAIVVLLWFPGLLLIGAGVSAPAFSRVFTWFGDVSYPLYVIHYPIVVAGSNMVHKYGLQGASLVMSALLCFAVVLIVALAVLRFYDEPVRSFLAPLLVRYRRKLA